MVVHRDRREPPHNLFDGGLREVHPYQMHSSVGGTIAFQVRYAAVVVAKLICIDAVLLALTKGLTHAIRSIPFAHYFIEQPIKVRVSIELVTADDQTADLVLSERDLGQ